MSDERKIKINARLTIPTRELQFRFVRSSGPGGQNVNKVNSKVVLVWNIAASPSLTDSQKERIAEKLRASINREGEFLVSSERSRSQKLNRDDCIEKLTTKVQNALAPKKIRKATKPSRAAREKRLDSKKRRSEIKDMRKRLK